jgi:hypothetical protein
MHSLRGTNVSLSLCVCKTILCCQDIPFSCRLFEWNCETAVKAQELLGNTPVKDFFVLLSIRIKQWKRYRGAQWQNFGTNITARTKSLPVDKTSNTFHCFRKCFMFQHWTGPRVHWALEYIMRAIYWANIETRSSTLKSQMQSSTASIQQTSIIAQTTNHVFTALWQGRACKRDRRSVRKLSYAVGESRTWRVHGDMRCHQMFSRNLWSHRDQNILPQLHGQYHEAT